MRQTVTLFLYLIWLLTGDPGIGQDILKQISIPILDISDQTERQVIIAQGTATAWQGHPSTLLMPDGKTIYCVWQGRRNHSSEHGAPAGYLKRSDDGGRTWSDYINVPANWLEIGRGHPTIHRLADPKGTARLFIFCRDANRTTFLQAMSEDEGVTWTEMRPIGLIDPDGDPIVGWTAPISILEAAGPNGVKKHLMWYERSRDGGPSPGMIWQSASYDGGLTWGEPQQLPLALSGDRHLPRYTPDGRLVILFRPYPPARSASLQAFQENYFTAWVGQYEDIICGREGQYLVRLIRSHHGPDHTYPGLEILPDGTLIGTTYIKYRPGPEMHSVVCVHFRLDEIELYQPSHDPRGSNADAINKNPCRSIVYRDFPVF